MVENQDQGKKVITRKKIDPKQGQDVISMFAKLPQSLSPRKYIEKHFQTLDNGSTVADVYDFLKKNNIDVGTLAYFRKLWSQVKKQQKDKPRNSPLYEQATAPTPVPTQAEVKVPAKPQTQAVTPQYQAPKAEGKAIAKDVPAPVAESNQSAPTRKPITLSNGTQGYIDVKTGNTGFEIYTMEEEREMEKAKKEAAAQALARP